MKKHRTPLLQIGISGLTGRMGKALMANIEKDSSLSLVAGHWKNKILQKVPFVPLADLCRQVEVIIDFSSNSITTSLLESAKLHNTPIVIGTTGLTNEQKDLMQTISRSIPIFYAPNFSIGLYLLHKVAKDVAKFFPSDIDIIETHHRHKKDAPSGSALFLADELEATIHSIRASNVIGSHEVRFYGEKERLFFSHEVKDRSTFAQGALTAAKFIHNKPAKIYSMEDLLCSHQKPFK